MKKSAILALGLISISGSVFATTSQSANSNAPRLVVGVYDVSSKVPTMLESRKYSASNKHHQLCWTAFNMTFQANNTVIERFVAPAKATFRAPGASVETFDDGKGNQITTQMKSNNGESITKCWRFDNSDPKGVYRLDIQINNTVFSPTQTVEIVK